jgi:hypothetical protein
MTADVKPECFVQLESTKGRVFVSTFWGEDCRVLKINQGIGLEAQSMDCSLLLNKQNK